MLSSEEAGKRMLKDFEDLCEKHKAGKYSAVDGINCFGKMILLMKRFAEKLQDQRIKTSNE